MGGLLNHDGGPRVEASNGSGVAKEGAMPKEVVDQAVGEGGILASMLGALASEG